MSVNVVASRCRDQDTANDFYFPDTNAQMFRPQDRVRLTQFPSGGGQGDPAWDFQFFIDKHELNRRDQFVMRAMLLPFESAEQVAQAT